MESNHQELGQTFSFSGSLEKFLFVTGTKVVNLVSVSSTRGRPTKNSSRGLSHLHVVSNLGT